MPNILKAVEDSFSKLNTSVEFAGSLLTIFDHFKNQNENHIEETLDTTEINLCFLSNSRYIRLL